MAGVRVKPHPPEPFDAPALLLWDAELDVEQALQTLKEDLAVPAYVVTSVERALAALRRTVDEVGHARPAGPVTRCEGCGTRLRLVRREPDLEAWVAVCLTTRCAAYGAPVVLAASGAEMPSRNGATGT